MELSEYLARITNIIMDNRWDLPTPGREAQLSSKYYGPDKAVREKISQEARKLKKSSEIENILIGYGLEAHSHYYLSLEKALQRGRKHPSEFSEYFRHWIYSDPGYIEPKVLSILSKWLNKPSSIKISQGDKYWYWRKSA